MCGRKRGATSDGDSGTQESGSLKVSPLGGRKLPRDSGMLLTALLTLPPPKCQAVRTPEIRLTVQRCTVGEHSAEVSGTCPTEVAVTLS